MSRFHRRLNSALENPDVLAGYLEERSVNDLVTLYRDIRFLHTRHIKEARPEFRMSLEEYRDWFIHTRRLDRWSEEECDKAWEESAA